MIPVIIIDDAARARDAGARFAVSPGFTATLSAACHAHGLPLPPGAVTAGEIMHAAEAGHRFLKFFPAASSGGAVSTGDWSRITKLAKAASQLRRT